MTVDEAKKNVRIVAIGIPLSLPTPMGDRQVVISRTYDQQNNTLPDLGIEPETFCLAVELVTNEAAKQFLTMIGHAPHELYAYMRRSLALEMDVIQNAILFNLPFLTDFLKQRGFSLIFNF
uniref:SFRICE_013141 n=1 Tax=Spodoptera frugiperda TaxID=7108 RepID=A0A2H1WV15_SPOFR